MNYIECFTETAAVASRFFEVIYSIGDHVLDGTPRLFRAEDLAEAERIAAMIRHSAADSYLLTELTDEEYEHRCQQQNW